MTKGPKIAVGGTLEEGDRAIHPTLFTDVTPTCSSCRRRIRPIVPVMTYKNINDVIAYISSRPKLLALCIYSNSQDRIDKVLSRTSSGGATIKRPFSPITWRTTCLSMASIKAVWAAIMSDRIP